MADAGATTSCTDAATAGLRALVAHAAAMARSHGAKLYLLHVEEGVTSQVYGSLSSTAEVEAGREYLSAIVESLKSEGVETEAVIRHADTARTQIIKAAMSQCRPIATTP